MITYFGQIPTNVVESFQMERFVHRPVILNCFSYEIFFLFEITHFLVKSEDCQPCNIVCSEDSDDYEPDDWCHNYNNRLRIRPKNFYHPYLDFFVNDIPNPICAKG